MGSPTRRSQVGAGIKPGPRETKHRRHSWGEPNRFHNPDRPDIGKTERECKHGCGIIKVTVKPGGGNRPWKEFWKDGEPIEGDHTPPCEGGA